MKMTVNLNHPLKATWIPTWVTIAATLLTLGWAIVFVVVAFSDPSTYQQMLAKDGPDGAGLVENLTVLVLLPAIAVAIITLVRYGRRLPWLLSGWLLCWTLACVYFAGEELSWGQWYFGWATPDLFSELNDQNETNLHNISSWLDQKPRTAVELFILLGGLILPALCHVAARLGRPLNSLDWLSPFLAPAMGWAAAGYCLLIRLAGLMPGRFFAYHDQSELHELAIAWFLSLYLVSYGIRLPQIAAAPSPAPSVPEAPALSAQARQP